MIKPDANDIPMKRCNRCPEGNQWHPATTEYFHRNWSKGKPCLHSWCKQCFNKWQAERRQHSSLNGHSKVSMLTVTQPVVGTWEQCGSCGTTKGNIIGDVDEITSEKYGYLCMKCYRLVSDFGGDPNRMRKAINYVEKTRLSRVAHKKKPTMLKP